MARGVRIDGSYTDVWPPEPCNGRVSGRVWGSDVATDVIEDYSCIRLRVGDLTFRKLTFRECRVQDVNVAGMAGELCLFDCLLDRCVVSGPVDRMSVRITPDARLSLAAAYSTVEWALDIRDCQPLALCLAGVPAEKIRCRREQAFLVDTKIMPLFERERSAADLVLLSDIGLSLGRASSTGVEATLIVPAEGMAKEAFEWFASRGWATRSPWAD